MKTPELIERDDNLRAMGFASYEEYLQSDLWAWIKSTLRNVGNGDKCVCCGSVTGLVWHHNSYSVPVLVGNFRSVCITNQAKSPVVRICSVCHQAIHFDKHGKFTYPSEWPSRLSMLKAGADPDCAIDTESTSEFDSYDP